MLVNKREIEEYFPIKLLRDNLLLPLTLLDLDPADYRIRVNVNGGGISGQAEAVRLGIARSLLLIDPEYRPALKKQRLLTRDSRMVERKKYGLHKARKAHQFSKR
jgi:small subunit ribosomal protein S9